MRHRQGESREQATLFPQSLDDYVSQDNPVRVIDAFIESLSVAELGFTQSVTKATGRKPYHPKDLLKLYTYGYLNQLRSTRRLEKECHRNIEVVWLMKKLRPDFKTIANFRQQNSQAIREACRALIQFCRQADVLDSRLIAIDGSKFRSAASWDSTYTMSQAADLQRRLSDQIDKYLSVLADSDEQEVLAKGSVEKALKRLRSRQETLDKLVTTKEQNKKSHLCETEPEAKCMRSGREGVIVGYNIQTAVEAGIGLIVHYDVTDESSDNRLLEPIAKAAQAELGGEPLEVLADAGYSNGEQLAQCEQSQITPTVPTNRAVNNRGHYYQKSAFTYDAQRDVFICPEDKELTYQTYHSKNKMRLYARTGCRQCPQQSKCTQADKRWISRHFYEEALQRSQQRVDTQPGIMRKRSVLVERPFAQLKHNMGIRRFRCWGKAGASAEMGLSVLAYNISRMMSGLGIQRTLALIETS